jgi:heme/copper-type cytochrome/quinol oxidase subunit 3
VFHSGVITITATASAANKNTNPARFIRWITATLGILFVIAIVWQSIPVLLVPICA